MYKLQFCTFISYYGEEISRLSRLVIEIPIFGYLGFLGYSSTSNAKSDDIFLLSDPDFLYGRRNFVPISISYRDPHFGYLGVLGFLGYLATSGAKSDVIFLLGDPDFLYRRRNFAPISLSYRDPQFGYLGVLGFGGPPNVVGLGKTFLHFPLSTSLMNTCLNHHCILLLGAEM